MWRSSTIREIGLGKTGGDGWGLMVDGYDCHFLFEEKM